MPGSSLSRTGFAFDASVIAASALISASPLRSGRSGTGLTTTVRW